MFKYEFNLSPSISFHKTKEKHDAISRAFSRKENIFQFRCLILTLKYQFLATVVAAAFHHTITFPCQVSVQMTFNCFSTEGIFFSMVIIGLNMN